MRDALDAAELKFLLNSAFSVSAAALPETMVLLTRRTIVRNTDLPSRPFMYLKNRDLFPLCQQGLRRNYTML